ncbi:MAG: hypothetical protein ACO1TE_05335 [Prosthecobacter sp.]
MKHVMIAVATVLALLLAAETEAFCQSAQKPRPMTTEQAFKAIAALGDSLETATFLTGEARHVWLESVAGQSKMLTQYLTDQKLTVFPTHTWAGHEGVPHMLRRLGSIRHQLMDAFDALRPDVELTNDALSKLRGEVQAVIQGLRQFFPPP